PRPPEKTAHPLMRWMGRQILPGSRESVLTLPLFLARRLWLLRLLRRLGFRRGCLAALGAGQRLCALDRDPTHPLLGFLRLGNPQFEDAVAEVSLDLVLL